MNKQSGSCEQCLPDATVWATSTPEYGPKSYYLKVQDGDTQIFFELRYSAQDKKIEAVPYTPQDYDYTLHDFCDHENGDCITETEGYLEDERIDQLALKAGYRRGKTP